MKAMSEKQQAIIDMLEKASEQQVERVYYFLRSYLRRKDDLQWKNP